MLKKINNDLIKTSNEEHRKRHGSINSKLLRMFEVFSDNTCDDDVRIKVATLNTIYGTAIQNIDPVTKNIVRVYSLDSTRKASPEKIVDLIAPVKWEKYERNNLSFASKFMHFESKYQLPIYDSYVWIVMTGYLIQGGEKISFTAPKSYAEFYKRYNAFVELYGLKHHAAYELDKFLWIYGGQLLGEIQRKQGVTLNTAKSILKRWLRT